ncbi:MAG: dethiobiotin synthase [Verrucomicrobia bacterium]|nr:MAG: dethiobiotin synthase [Verrucomicrobiota bacterium]
MNYFITGTDTNVGKTYVTSLLLRSLRSQKVDAVGMKPIETGGRHDAEKLCAAMGGLLSLEEINPVFLEQPLAPAIAAEREGRTISLEQVFESYRKLSDSHSLVFVEGAGGWRVPIAAGYEMADLAGDLTKISPLQVIVVVLNRLGAINHALLTVESILARGLDCAGFVLNQGTQDFAAASNAHWIAQKVPLWFEVASGQEVLPDFAIPKSVKSDKITN